MNQIRLLIVVMALAGSVYGQAFEVASVREADPALALASHQTTRNSGFIAAIMHEWGESSYMKEV